MSREKTVVPPAPMTRAVAAWNAVARTWAQAYRAGLDPARQVADRAMMELVRQVPSGPVLDAGCGEGWLARELAGHRHVVTAFDAAPEMLALAGAEHPRGDYRLLSFDEAAADPRRLGGAFGTIVFNFSLLEERITPMLEAAGAVLFPYGRVLIQAAHPAMAVAGRGTYRDGWRMMDELAPGLAVQRGVPWYFRTFSRWILDLRRAGLLLVETYEPLDDATGKPVSLLIHATVPEFRKRTLRGPRRSP